MKTKFAILFLLLGLISCTEKNDQNVQNLHKDQIEGLQKRVDDLEIQMLSHDLFEHSASNAFLKPSSTGYTVIKLDLGYLTVQIVDATQFANSTKVKIKFGNPLGSTIKGLQGKFEWGSVNEKGVVKEELGSKEISLNEPLAAGAWTTATIVLEGLDVKNFGYLRIKNLSHTGIVLSTR